MHPVSSIHRCYELSYAERRTPVTITIKVNARHDSHTRISGIICVDATFEDPNDQLDKRTLQSGTLLRAGISTPTEGVPHIRVEDFVLPRCLRQAGIGTFIWSAIFSALPRQISQSVRLSGSLSATDATTPKVGRDGLVFKECNPLYSGFADVSIPNIARRNAFWLRMLADSDRVFACDAGGSGRFEGFFIDPATHPSYQPVFAARRIT
ncbi:hypothetical protein [Aromatoleum evansii]|uniref:hypothetical protein n=1 Tax=Aromatoleum evansii TaxID=59406 RepID=UPI00145F9707|nr:hypothetical protein [Aromatoleum evansii]NMG29631.1 hypothetical protein [Aromatoleum evansii]